jgi:hypothetical protein
MYFYARNRRILRSYGGGGYVSDGGEDSCTDEFVEFEILNIFTYAKW